MAEPELLTLSNAARTLGLSRPTLYKMAARGDAQFVRLAGRTLMRRAEVERIAASAEAWRPDAGRSAKANAARRRRPAIVTHDGGQVFG